MWAAVHTHLEVQASRAGVSILVEAQEVEGGSSVDSPALHKQSSRFQRLGVEVFWVGKSDSVMICTRSDKRERSPSLVPSDGVQVVVEAMLWAE